MELTVPRIAKKETIFARIFDMSLHIIISGDTNDQNMYREYKWRREGEEGKERGKKQTEERST